MPDLDGNPVAVVTPKPRSDEPIQDTIAYLHQDLDLYVVDWEFPEFNHKESLSLMAIEAARHCATGLFNPVIVTATGLYIQALNGFPGLYTGYIMKRIGNSGILKLMNGESNRNSLWRFVLVYCEPTKEPVAFEGVTIGTLLNQERGNEGYVFDSIFVPEKSNTTFAEHIELKKIEGARWKACQLFLSWYRNYIN